MKNVVIYPWRVRDAVTRKMFTTRWLATEETIRKTYPEAVRSSGAAKSLQRRLLTEA